MPEYTHRELAADRIASTRTQWQVANECGVSETTIKRWESGKWETGECRKPDPDDILRYLKAIGRPERWRDWMRSHYDSCREMLVPAVQLNDLLYAVAHSRKEVGEVAEALDMASNSILSGVIGEIDCPEIKQKLLTEAEEARSSLDTLILELHKKEMRR